MARLINAANVEGNNAGLDDYTPIPDNDYPVIITASDFKPTKAKTGHYLQVTLTIFEGEYKGRKLWDNLNLDNPNPVAIEIANKTLNSICQACGKVGVEDSTQLHGIPMFAKVVIKPATAARAASNDIKFYGPYDGNTTPQTAAATAQTKPAATGGQQISNPPADKMQEANPIVGAAATTGAKPKLPWE